MYYKSILCLNKSQKS